MTDANDGFGGSQPATMRWWQRLSMWWNVDDGGDPFAPVIPGSGVVAASRLAGMNKREQDEFLIVYGSRRQRKEARARRKARELAKKQKREQRPG